MEDVINELSQPIWWVSVVVAGIAINLLSSYIKPFLDKAAASWSVQYRERNKKKAQEVGKYLDKLSQDHHFQMLELFAEMRLRKQSTHFLLLGVFIIVTLNMFSMPYLVRIGVLSLSAFCFFFSYLTFVKAAIKSSKISEVLGGSSY